jgi:hypothetical protein
MALEKTFQELPAELRRLRDTILGLRLTVVEDKPRRDEVVLVEHQGNAVEDLLGWAEEAVVAAVEAQQAVAHPLNEHRARHALTTCQDRYNRLVQQYWSELASYEQIAELMRFGRSRRGEWQAWTRGVRQALEDCRRPLQDAGQALFRCWQDLAERLGMSSVSIQNTTIGQQISTPELAKNWTGEGIT